MNLNQKKDAKEEKLLSYHWLIATIAFLLMFFYGGTLNNLTSLHLIPLTEALSVSRSTVTLALSSRIVVTTVITFFSGFFVKRFGVRATSGISLIVAAGAYVILAYASGISTLVFGGVLMGITQSFCTTGSASFIIRSWFHRHQGAVLGLVTAASGIGSSLFCILQTELIKKGSFPYSFLFCACVTLSFAIVFIFFIRNSPEEKGLFPLGEGEEQIGKRKKISDNAFPGFSIQELYRRPTFYLMILCLILSGFSVYTVFSVNVSHLKDCGFSSDQASGLNSIMMLLLTGTKFLVGLLSDKLGARRINLVCLVFSALSLVTLALTTNYATALLAMILYSVALPLVTIMTPLIAFSVFGYRAQMEYTGIFLAIIAITSFLGEYFSNLIYDLTSSYRIAFFIGAAVAVVSLILYLILYRLAERDKIKLLSKEKQKEQTVE